MGRWAVNIIVRDVRARTKVPSCRSAPGTKRQTCCGVAPAENGEAALAGNPCHR